MARRLAFSPNALTVLKKRYLLRDGAGVPVESPEELLSRVASAIAEPEEKNRGKWRAAFEELLFSLRFLPNSPTLMNAGKPDGQLSACYVLPVEDSLADIFDALKNAALIHQSGGGTGFSFSRLRPKGSTVHTTSGVASGPVSFMRIFDAATDTIKQGGTRRGANMAILRVDHPDILEFIDAKSTSATLSNFNLSVGITDEFMAALAREGLFALKNPTRGTPVTTLPAKMLFDRITRAAWACGDPGVVFLDRINLLNPTPRLGRMESTNPCGEQPLLPFESCNLGSLNLGAYVHGDVFDWKLLRNDVGVAMRFLDNVIDANTYPIEASRKITLRNRKIGLGVMGFADALLLLGIPYDSHAAFAFGEKVMSFIRRAGHEESRALARLRGAFPNWKGSMWHKLGMKPLRNATVTTVAPTGTISLLAGVSSGIEPIYSGIFYKNVLDTERLEEIHPAVRTLLSEHGRATAKNSELGPLLGPAWRPAPLISVESHVRMQAVFQRHSDSAVSKTINLPESATPDDIAHALLLAYRWGCKGITVYRDKSKQSQVLECPPEERQEFPACPSC